MLIVVVGILFRSFQFFGGSMQEKFEHSAPLVMGSKLLEKLVNDAAHAYWGIGVIFMTEMAHEVDNQKHYWIVRKNNGEFISISCTLDMKCLGWGTIRRNKSGEMQVCQVLPRHIEASLRKQTFEKIKFQIAEEKSKALSGVLHKFND